MRIGVLLGAGLVVLLVAGCGSGDAGPPGAEGTVVGPTSGGTGPDTPVGGDDEGSVDLPGLPIGGSVAFDAPGASTCAFLAWNGETLPAGVVARIGALTFPAGVGADTSGSCDGPPCLGGDSFTAEQQTCAVGLTWDGTPSSEDDAVIGASGTAVCETQEVCDQVRSSADATGGVAFVQLPESSETTDTTSPSS